MKISYDSKYDVLYMKFSDGKVADTIEADGGLLIDYGEQKEVIGIEIINASSMMKTKPLQEIVIKIQEDAEA